VTRPPPPSTAEIAALLAWARRLTEQGRHADPAERAAYQARLPAHLAAQPASDSDNTTGMTR
jgi:hypothetical protein